MRIGKNNASLIFVVSSCHSAANHPYGHVLWHALASTLSTDVKATFSSASSRRHPLATHSAVQFRAVTKLSTIKLNRGLRPIRDPFECLLSIPSPLQPTANVRTSARCAQRNGADYPLHDIRASPDCQFTPPRSEWLYFVAGLNRSGQGSFDFAGSQLMGCTPASSSSWISTFQHIRHRNDGGGTRY